MPEEIFDVVDEHDHVIGQAPRSQVHAQGLLHRAASIFVFNSPGARKQPTSTRCSIALSATNCRTLTAGKLKASHSATWKKLPPCSRPTPNNSRRRSEPCSNGTSKTFRSARAPYRNGHPYGQS